MKRLKHLLLSEYLICFVCVGYFAVMALVLGSPWVSRYNLENLLAALLPLLVLAIGQMFVMITAGIDLSVTAVIAFASVVGASLMSQEIGLLAGSSYGFPVALAAMLLVGTSIGALNGFAVAFARMPPFVVTLSTLTFFAGLATWYSAWFVDRYSPNDEQSSSIGDLPDAFTAIWDDWTLPIVATVAIASYLLLSKSVLGHWLYAVGTNPKASRVSGLPVRSTILSAYLICGLCAAIASILYTSQLATGYAELAATKSLDVIGATVIGGTSLFGGKGKVQWVLFGVVFLVLIDSSLSMLSLPSNVVEICKGAVILVAAVLDATRNRIRLTQAL